MAILEDIELAAPCGLYCAICPDHVSNSGGDCHGCGCKRGDCAAQDRHAACAIYQCCVVEKGLEDCTACPDFPCLSLIRFTHDPLNRNHLPAMINLQRRQRMGVARWLEEERVFWQNDEHRSQWLQLQRELEEKRQQWEKRRLLVKNGGEDEEKVAGWCHFWRTLRRARGLSRVRRVSDERH
ncbi:MAG: DUF3795 domain-containing protein [Anaerolineae bacterium]